MHLLPDLFANLNKDIYYNVLCALDSAMQILVICFTSAHACLPICLGGVLLHVSGAMQHKAPCLADILCCFALQAFGWSNQHANINRQTTGLLVLATAWRAH
jgi:hypothetical protein